MASKECRHPILTQVRGSKPPIPRGHDGISQDHPVTVYTALQVTKGELSTADVIGIVGQRLKYRDHTVSIFRSPASVAVELFKILNIRFDEKRGFVRFRPLSVGNVQPDCHARIVKPAIELRDELQCFLFGGLVSVEKGRLHVAVSGLEFFRNRFLTRASSARKFS